MACQHNVEAGTEEHLQVVFASLNSAVSDGSLKESDVRGLMFANLNEPLASKGGQTGLVKVCIAVLSESAGIERVLQVFECKSILEDLSICFIIISII